jgi:hypothetical protein
MQEQLDCVQAHKLHPMLPSRPSSKWVALDCMWSNRTGLHAQKEAYRALKGSFLIRNKFRAFGLAETIILAKSEQFNKNRRGLWIGTYFLDTSSALRAIYIQLKPCCRQLPECFQAVWFILPCAESGRQPHPGIGTVMPHHNNSHYLGKQHKKRRKCSFTISILIGSGSSPHLESVPNSRALQLGEVTSRTVALSQFTEGQMQLLW